MSLPPFGGPNSVSLNYVVPQEVRQEDVPQLVRYLKSVYSRRDAKQTVNNLESGKRLEKGVHDNLQGLLDRAPDSDFMFVGGKRKNRSRRSKKRSNRKRNAATRRRKSRSASCY